MLDYRSADETQTDCSSLSAHKNKNHFAAHKKLIKHAVNKNAVSNANIHRQKINKYLTTSRGHTKNGFLSVTQTLLTPGQMTHFVIIWIPTMGSGSSDSRKKRAAAEYQWPINVFDVEPFISRFSNWKPSISWV